MRAMFIGLAATLLLAATIGAATKTRTQNTNAATPAGVGALPPAERWLVEREGYRDGGY